MKTMIALLTLLVPTAAFAEIQTVKHRVTGLFSKDRIEDLRQSVKKIPDVTLVEVDFDHAEVALSYDPLKLVGKGKEKEIPDRLDNLLRAASSHTLGIRPLSTTPRDKLTRIEFGVLGLDCKACCLAAYESIYKIDGVEQATASFKDGLVTALIDPAKTNRAALEEALKKRQVTLKTP